MAKKTNKTSHVMDLLTNGASPEPSTAPASPETPPSPEKKGDIQSHTVTPKKVTVVDEGSRNDRLSSEILNKLSEELEQEQVQEAQDASEPMERPIEAEEPVPSLQTEPEEQTEESSSLPSEDQDLPLPSQEPSEEPPAEDSLEEAEAIPPVLETQNVQEEDTVQEADTVQEENPSVPKTIHPIILPPSQINEHLHIKEYHFVNVMEQLIMRQNMESFFEQYGVCRCERCVSDVYALALTGLPSKYVVVTQDSLSPILSYYESKYKIYMLTEIIKACNRVRENPRHKS